MATTNIPSQTNELKVVHPATAQWLTEHGYIVQHEVPMPFYGIADFVAEHTDGHILIIECKPTARQIGRAIMQVKDYCDQYGKHAYPSVSFPAYSVNTKTRQTCKKRGVFLIAVDVAPDVHPESKPREDYELLKSLCRQMAPSMMKAFPPLQPGQMDRINGADIIHAVGMPPVDPDDNLPERITR